MGDFCQNFSRQIFFPLAMATKMVAAWSADIACVLPQPCAETGKFGLC